ncbi:CRISPR-associated endonuclease Cas2 [Candidatus Kaiserbacteria bacterium RIFCSPLOWO2_01_FULL_55_19]|uniref:CRISPR-associated endonuclease Cas2 n=1 Tax=Candidatus Kaiserbacteria bacterium RIFCSPLOWO2_01_FULL_55_19 TaxID=1798516 RepID=A0A1F6ESG6_9BACT|nr:MAG: CRISPR-associated endonuclease Cas2 [Candidatus Kaiserbacteria bacterium RIFCSPLOWO2_01_FULL_55_19]
MESVEAGAKKKRQRRNLRNAALMAIGVAGIITVAAVAPNMFQMLGRTGALARLKYRSKGILARLKQRGEIEFVEHNGKKYIRLTDKGERVLDIERRRLDLLVNKPKKWDGRYRLVMFDIPEKRKKIREHLRFEMQEIGFLRIQDSVWIYPYDCEEFIALLKADLHIGKDILYAVIEEIENDMRIRKHFNLQTN